MVRRDRRQSGPLPGRRRRPPLLLLTAGPTWSFLFRNVIRELRGQFRCIALDAPGFGLSEAALEFPFTIAATSAVVEQLVDALEHRDLLLLVHDLGGPIGLSVAARRPDLFRALVVTDTFGFPIGEFPEPARILRFVSGPIFSFLNANFNLLARVMARWATRRRGLTPAEQAAYIGTFPTRQSRRNALRLFGDAPRSDALMRQVERALRTDLNHLPVLLLYGEHDPTRKQGFQARWERIFPHARSVVIAGAGHFPHEDAPDEVAAALRDWWHAVERRE